MNIDYSQFYRGTTNIPSYGNGIYKKDTLVKYEFNTTDEHGNKIMDKMSREETLQAMKDIGSQYGDAVIVEFSGDGMAALVENKKGIVDANVTQEQRESMEARNAAFQKEITQVDNSLELPAYSGMVQTRRLHLRWRTAAKRNRDLCMISSVRISLSEILAL